MNNFTSELWDKHLPKSSEEAVLNKYYQIIDDQMLDFLDNLDQLLEEAEKKRLSRQRSIVDKKLIQIVSFHYDVNISVSQADYTLELHNKLAEYVASLTQSRTRTLESEGTTRPWNSVRLSHKTNAEGIINNFDDSVSLLIFVKITRRTRRVDLIQAVQLPRRIQISFRS